MGIFNNAALSGQTSLPDFMPKDITCHDSKDDTSVCYLGAVGQGKGVGRTYLESYTESSNILISTL
jgi:hypothetical protein